MEEKNNMATRRMTLTRIVNAPIELVWEAWTDPAQVAQWWGPNGFSSPVCKWDAQAGNEIYIDMQAPDGTIFPMDGEFIEIEKPTKLVFIAAALDATGKRKFENLNTVTFTGKGDKTEIQVHVTVSKITPEAEVHLKGMNEGWSQSMDKLATFVLNNRRTLSITRLLDAPRELVFEVWTDPEHIKHWWGPDGFTNTISKMDVVPGGEWEFIMHGPDGTDYKNMHVYKEIIKPEKLVLEHVSGPRFLLTVTFAAQGDKTLLTMAMLFDTAEQKENTVREFKADVGLVQNIDKLENLLGTLTKPIVIEKEYNAPAAVVWKAITDKDQMKEWYFELAEFKPEVGFEFEFYGQGREGEKYLHLCKVKEVIPGKKITYSWRYENFLGNSLVSFELFANGEKTTLRLTHTGLESFAGNGSSFTIASFTEGWTMLIGTLLKEYVEKK